MIMAKFVFVCTFTFVLLLCVKPGTTDNAEKANFKEYCVIGAGPGGLQMAYFLNHAKHDYVVFEKGPGAATFYTKFPIHRKLISLNKIQTGKTNKEFNFRHDWNSLVGDDESLQLTKYTKEFFPNAGILVKYLHDYVARYNLNMQYNTTISNVMKRNDGLFTMNDQHGTQYTCKYVIMATGIAKPNKPNVEGSEHFVGYEDLTLNLKDYEGKNVMIIGHGNSAFEVAEHIMPVTNVIHMMARHPIKLAWGSHYVGDLRAVNVALLDTSLLKSLDGIFLGSIEDNPVSKSPIDGRLYLKDSPTDNTVPGGNKISKHDNDILRNGYDMIIRCMGFTFDDSIFHENVTIRRAGAGGVRKYPLTNLAYESMDMENLYFAGAISHVLDFKKSAGAFIHGYRYTARTLARLLEWKNHGIQWPSVHFDNLLDLTPHICKRFNEASDIYQMFGVLCEVVIFSEDKTEATYLEAVPCALASKIPMITGHDVPGAYMLISMEYGRNNGSIPGFKFNAQKAHQSHFLHPIVYYYNHIISDDDYQNRPKAWPLPIPDRHHHIVEDFLTKFDGYLTHVLSLRKFIEDATKQDLRFFYADQCMMMSLTTSDIPRGCQYPSNANVSSSVLPNADLAKWRVGGHFLPFQAMQS